MLHMLTGFRGAAHVGRLLLMMVGVRVLAHDGRVDRCYQCWQGLGVLRMLAVVRGATNVGRAG